VCPETKHLGSLLKKVIQKEAIFANFTKIHDLMHAFLGSTPTSDLKGPEITALWKILLLSTCLGTKSGFWAES
jgi:hypothetical protein